MHEILKSILREGGNLTKVTVPTIRTDENGFNALADIHSRLVSTKSPFIDWGDCRFFDANMSAALAACTEKVISRKLITHMSIPDKISATLRRNGFLCRYGFDEVNDTYGTSVGLHEINKENYKSFSVYISQLFNGKGFPNVTDRLKNRIVQSLMEVANNSLTHSEASHGIFCCGQVFPQSNAIKLSIVDTGIGIRRKIQKELGLKMNSDTAIEWAMIKGNTTKKAVPGGLGLDFLREFIKLNRGSMIVASDRGYWANDTSGTAVGRIEKSFPGTAVTININTADKSSYKLSSE